MRIASLFFIFFISVNSAFAETRARATYKNSYDVTQKELFEQLGVSNVKLICIEKCHKKEATVYILYNRDSKKNIWVWTADYEIRQSFNSQAMSFSWLVKYDDNRQITWIDLGLDFPKEEKKEVIQEHKSDPIDWDEVRRISQESIDAHKDPKRKK